MAYTNPLAPQLPPLPGKTTIVRRGLPPLPGGGKGVRSGYTYTGKYTLPRTSAPRTPTGVLASTLAGGNVLGGTRLPVSTPQQTQGAPPIGGSSNLDSTALGNEATNLFDTTNKINALTDQGAANEVALQSALGALAYQKPYDQLAELYNANKSGGLYSTVEGQQQGRIADSYLSQGDTLRANAGVQQTDIDKQIAALTDAMKGYNAAQALASSERLLAAAAKNPDVVAPTPPLTSNKALVAAVASGKLKKGITRPLTKLPRQPGILRGLTKGIGPPLQGGR